MNGLYCVCAGDGNATTIESLCSPTQYLNCTKTNSLTKKKCHIQGRGKRGVGNTSSKEIQRILSKIAVDFNSRTKVSVVLNILCDICRI